MKFTTVYKSIVITALSTLVLAACTRSSKEEAFLGPKVLPAPEGFAIQGDSLGFKFTNSGTSVDFLTGTSSDESSSEDSCFLTGAFFETIGCFVTGQVGFEL